MPRKVYVFRVIRWEEFFENAQSRRYKSLSWVPLPNRFDGLSFRRLTGHQENVAGFCAWCLIVECASKCPVRGVLADEKGPMTAEDLGLMTGFPAGLFTVALSILTSPAINWMERIEYNIAKPLIGLALQSPLPVFFPEYDTSALGACTERAALERKKGKKEQKELSGLSIWELKQKLEALRAIWELMKQDKNRDPAESKQIKADIADVEKRIAHYGKA